ncbi:hypothetical protein N7470_002584 [Penicillium chermesinum]|nr:hypothetical protein N7470_002584 [Penicillium chermesinum]
MNLPGASRYISDATFPAVVDLITAYVKHEFYEQYESLRKNPRTAHQADVAIFDELWAAYKPRVMDDATQFDGLSIDQLRTQFDAWAKEQGQADRFPSYRMFIVVDEESFNSLQNTPLPAELPTGIESRVAHYRWCKSDDPTFPGWMKCSLKGLWDMWRNMGDGDYMRKSYVLVSDHRDVY